MKFRQFLVTITGLALSAAVVAQSAYRWDSVAIGGGGFVSAVIASKTQQNLFYARTDVGGSFCPIVPNGRIGHGNAQTNEATRRRVANQAAAS